MMEDTFESIKDSDNPDEINDFLINLGNNPALEYIVYLDYFLTKRDLNIYNKIKINLFWALGEFGGSFNVKDSYIELLLEEYNKSDRWVRNEILKSLNKMNLSPEIQELISDLVALTINDDYVPIALSSLELILSLNNISDQIIRNVLRLTNSPDSELISRCELVLQKFIYSEESLFSVLNKTNNYKHIKNKGIRTILLILFKSVINLEIFRQLIETSNWENNIKEIYLKEIDTYKEILLKTR